MKRLIIVILFISLTCNVFLLYRLHSSDEKVDVLINTNSESQQRQDKDTSEKLVSNQVLQRNNKHETPQNLSSNKQLSLVDLNELMSTGNYEKLAFELQNYLRLYPQDIDALLLEAKLYLYTKPLNEALVHYQTLLSLPLSASQISEIREIIDVNASRVIQQFTGDHAWDLLAMFLEPLIQIDPLNKQYLLALARAYGMQNQITLMNNVLASLNDDDPRALRLRNKVLERLTQQSTEDERINDLSSMEFSEEERERRPDIIVSQTQGQYRVNAASANINMNLLIDTGASTTALSETKFSEIDPTSHTLLGQFTINTAGGIIQAPIYRLQEFTLGSNVMSGISVIILPDNNLSNFDGLLGMNVLNRYDLVVNSALGTLNMYTK